MDTIVKYMIDRKWANDKKSDRKLFLWKLAQKSKEEKEVSHKIGGMLICKPTLCFRLELILYAYTTAPFSKGVIAGFSRNGGFGRT